MSTLYNMGDTVHIGVDLDNTLASLDHLFQERAARRGWIAGQVALDKGAVRAAIRALPDGELCWQALQAEVYGPAMVEARLMTGARDFLRSCHQRGVTVFIVSHKTPYAGMGDQRVDLRAAAWAWLEDQGFFDPLGMGLSRERVFFEETRAEKLARLAGLNLAWFVDDLPEVLADPGFPVEVGRLWYNPAGLPDLPGVLSCATWQEVQRHVCP